MSRLPETIVVLVVMTVVVVSRMSCWHPSFASSNSNVRGTSVHVSINHGIYRSISQEQSIPADYVSPTSIAFLFLSAGEDMNEAIWESWFPPKDDDRFSIYVHTERVQANATFIPNMPPFFCPHVIPSVESGWYRLHPAMMRLLQHAYSHSHATQFVFVSPTTIPLKSFSDVYDDLSRDNDKSRLCMTPTGQARSNWRNVHTQVGVSLRDVAKAELWSTLSRSHVRLILEHEHTLEGWNSAFVQESGGSPGAPDESLLPTLLKKYVRDELRTCHGAIDRKKNDLPHGCCSTYVKWDSKYNDTHYVIDPSVIDEITHQQANAPYFWHHQSCATHHPCSYSVLQERGLRELVKSKHYMFLRKALPGTVVVTEAGDTLSLALALPQLYRDEPLVTSSDRRRTVSADNKDEQRHFVCKGFATRRVL